MKVERSIAEGPLDTPGQDRVDHGRAGVVVGLLIALGALVVYAISDPVHYNQYNHFVWQADAFLHGRAWFPYPVQNVAGMPDNWYFQDVYPIRDALGNATGRVLLPFPPLPAIVLLPFVAVFGLFTDQEAVSIWLSAGGVGAAWWLLGGLRLRLSVRALTTLVFATGTVWWWAASVGSTWYLAHLVAVDLALLAVGITLRHDPRAADERPGEEDDRELDRLDASLGDAGYLRRLRGSAWPLERSQVLAGLLLGLAVTARLPLVLAAPWFIFVGGGGSRVRRLVSTGAGALLPVAALVLYTFVTTGALVHPGYDYQYQLEANGYPSLGYHPDWSVEDIRYIPQNLGIMFGALPVVAPTWKPNTLGFGDPVAMCAAPGAVRSLFDQTCPLVMPVDIGTSILLSAPGLLLGLLAFRRRGLTRLTIGASAAIVIIAAFNLAHFSQGWVQWGYRFSLDFVPFALPMVALGAARADGRPRMLAIVLVVAGALVNLWGVTWGQILGW